MHVRIRISLAGVALLVAACQAQGLDGISGATARTAQVAATCADYQPCRVAGTLSFRPRAGGAPEAMIVRSDGSCVPLLLGRRQVDIARRSAGKPVVADGLALVRLSDGPAETLENGYFDRWLPVGFCPGVRVVLYVRTMSAA